MMKHFLALTMAVTAAGTIATSGEARAELAYRHLATTSSIVVNGGHVTMSPGYSFRPNLLVTPRVVAQLAGPNCRAYVQSAQYTGNPRPIFAQRMNRFPDGSFEVPFGSVTWVAFEITQPFNTASSICDLHFYALLETGTAPAPVDPSQPTEPQQPTDPDAQEILLGAVNYSGGFGRDLPVVQSGRGPLDGIVTGIRVAIPEFCQHAEVLAAGTVSEGKYDAAAPASNIPGAFIVNGGQGLRASDILVTLNGPFDAQCAVPVYVRVKR
ncbi:hypothetical protein EBZ80_02985 [bacterium]|nr:hypothetical protein [bacterium]